MSEDKDKALEQIWLAVDEYPANLFRAKPADHLNSTEYIRADLVATKVREAREGAFNESAESIVNEAGKVGQLMNLASASARREERAVVKETLVDYFKHFPCTCVGRSRTGGHFACCPITIRDEVLGRLAALERAADSREGESLKSFKGINYDHR